MNRKDIENCREPNMYLTTRQSEIVELAKTEGRVLVDDLANHFDVTPQTIRLDLNRLCKDHVLVRFHGGALYAESNENVEYEARRQIASAEKMAIGQATAKTHSGEIFPLHQYWKPQQKLSVRTWLAMTG